MTWTRQIYANVSEYLAIRTWRATRGRALDDGEVDSGTHL